MIFAVFYVWSVIALTLCYKTPVFYSWLLFKVPTSRVFEPPFGSLDTTYDLHLGLIGKRVVDFLLVLVLIEVFSLVVMAESLRAKRSKIGDFAPTRSLWSKFSDRSGHLPPIIFARLVMPMNASQRCRWQFSHRETLQQTFFERIAIFYGNRPFCVFETPMGDLGATYDDHLRLIGSA